MASAEISAERNGRASSLARDDLSGMVLDIASTPLDLIEETVRLCSSRAGEMITHGLIEQADAVDAIWAGCEAAGYVKDRGADATQKLIGENIVASLATAKSEAALSAPDMSILKRNRTPAPLFPLDVLGPAAPWVDATAASKSAPIDYVALGLIVTAAGIIGPKRRVSPWEGWEEPSILWGALIGAPSMHKSPPLDPLRDAVRHIERQANEDWTEKQAKYETDKKIAEARREAWEQKISEAVKSGATPPARPDDAVTPKSPTKHRLWIVDSTTEKVARILGDNPSGLICFRDELSGLLGGFDKYGGSGGDRAFWIEAYGGRSYRYDRVSLKDEVIDIPFCAVSLLGALQPDRLSSMLLQGDDDGLAARPLYAWPDPVRPRRPIAKADDSLLVTALSRLASIEFDKDERGEFRARTMSLEEDAATEFQSWWEYTQWDAKLAANGRLAGAVGKLDGVTLRLAQVLEFLAWAWRQSNTIEPERISLQSTRNAIRLVDGWVRANLERVFAEASLPEQQRDAIAVGRWLLKNKREKVNARDLRRLPGFPGPKEAKELDAAIEFLVDARWLTQEERAERAGRPRKDFMVNPAVYQAG